jgi:hypothetical protein
LDQIIFSEFGQTDDLGTEDTKEAKVCEKEVENDNEILKIQLKMESTQQTGDSVSYAPAAHANARRTKEYDKRIKANVMYKKVHEMTKFENKIERSASPGSRSDRL